MSQTVARGLLLLNALAEDGPSSPQLLAESLEINRTIVHRLLQSLVEAGFVEKSGGTFRLSHDLPRIAQSVERRLRTAALIEITALGESTGLPVFVFIRDGDEAIALISHVPQIRSQIRVIPQIGFAVNLTQSAGGLALLAFGQAKDRQQMLSAALRPKTSTELIKVTVAQGYAESGLNIETEWDEIAVPIVDSGQVNACLSILVSSTLEPDRPNLIRELLRTSKHISANLESIQ
jgi:DNA-binding IclR family transcriptional regulator